jgi:hypothetical protein
MPVPRELHLTCQGCGRDLTGLEQRTCPGCRRPFNIPIPAELALRCPRCGYELTGLTSRRCPECGTPFLVSELLSAPADTSRYPLWDRVPWVDMLQWAAGFLLGAVGVALALRGTLMMGASVYFLYIMLFGGTLITVRGYTQELSGANIAIRVGIFWLAMGTLMRAFG